MLFHGCLIVCVCGCWRRIKSKAVVDKRIMVAVIVPIIVPIHKPVVVCTFHIILVVITARQKQRD